jgi:replicative DNA helicase
VSNIAAEKVFLAGVVRHPGRFFEFVEFLDESDFQHSVTKMTFEAIRSLVIDKEAETVTKAKLVAEAKALGHHNYLSATKNGQWIDELLLEDVAEHEIDAHFLEVKRQSVKDQYVDSFINLRDYLSCTEDPLSIMISKVENEIFGKVNTIDKGQHAIEDMRDGFWEFIDSVADDPGHLGLDLGYPLWQERIGQIRNGAITFLVATTKAGKSQFGLRSAITAARKGLPVLYLDSELNKHDQWIRQAAMMTKIPSQYIETGLWNMSESQLLEYGIEDPTKRDEIIKYGTRLRDPRLRDAVQRMPIFYQSISGLNVSDVIPHMRRWLLTHVKPDRQTRVPQCLIVYDYIKLTMTDEVRRGVLQEYQQHGLNVAELHDFVNKYNVPMIAFGQTNNEIDDDLRCVAGAKRISENVDSISLLKRKGDKELAQDPTGTHLMRIFAARYGRALHNSYVNFRADLSCGDFEEIDIGNVASSQQDDNDDDNDK